MINIYNNDELSKYSDWDKKALTQFLENYYLTLRDSLNLGNKYTFGAELEAENAYMCEAYHKFTSHNLIDFTVKEDTTVYDGCEVVTPPLKDFKSDWKKLEEGCRLMAETGSEGHSCGGHIHVGMQGFKNMNAVNNFIKLWVNYEDVIFRFCFGEYINPRPAIKRFGMPVYRMYIDKEFEDLEELRKYSIDRYQAINFKNAYGFRYGDKNTLEFRNPNCSLNPIILQNYINLFCKMIEKANNTEYSYIHQDDMGTVDNYKGIREDKALDFCDEVFDNNLDKIYFLRQYFKDYRVGDQSVFMIKSKKFTK